MSVGVAEIAQRWWIEGEGGDREKANKAGRKREVYQSSAMVWFFLYEAVDNGV